MLPTACMESQTRDPRMVSSRIIPELLVVWSINHCCLQDFDVMNWSARSIRSPRGNVSRGELYASDLGNSSPLGIEANFSENLQNQAKNFKQSEANQQTRATDALPRFFPRISCFQSLKSCDNICLAHRFFIICGWLLLTGHVYQSQQCQDVSQHPCPCRPYQRLCASLHPMSPTPNL